MSILKVMDARVFAPLNKPARYKGAYGGRGSGKSHYFASALVRLARVQPGLRVVCIREIQKSLKESAKRLIETKILEYGFTEDDGFVVRNDRIDLPGGGVIIFQGMQDHTSESIKSLEGFDIAWVEEAQTLSRRSLAMLRPTIRKEGSELWFSWNPRRKNDPVDEMFRQGNPPTDSVCVRANWNDNPWLPDVLEQERQDCLSNEPDQYGHIWEGDYITVASGAYYAQKLAKARAEKRITTVPIDPLMTIRLFADIGGTGANADHFVFWVCQFIGQQILCVDHYEAQGQPIEAHAAWLRERGYKPNTAQIWLPHDGATNDKVHDVSYAAAFRKIGYNVEVIPNQGKGAAMIRVNTARNLFDRIWFDAEKCQAGLEALGWYHERKDETRNIGLGPEHDWASHSADAFGLMCCAWQPPKIKKPIQQPRISLA